MSPPHAPCSPSAGAVAWPPTLLPTPLGSYPNRFSPYLCPTGPSAGLLAVAVLRHLQVAPQVPPLAVSRGSLPPKGGQGVGKFLWVAPAAAHHKLAGSIIAWRVTPLGTGALGRLHLLLSPSTVRLLGSQGHLAPLVDMDWRLHYTEHDVAIVARSMLAVFSELDTSMGRIVAITNLKGGIGKTTTVVNLSAGLALKGAQVLLVDVDAQGNLAMALGLKPRRTLYDVLVDGKRPEDCLVNARPNLDLLAANESLLTAQPELARRPDWARVLEQALRPVRSKYDFILIDCGGSLTVLNLNALNAASDVVVPTTVEPFSIKGLEMLVKQIIQLKGSTRSLRAIVPTMYDPRTRQSVALLEQLQAQYGAQVTPPIRVNVRLSESSAQGKTIYEFDPRSRGALDYAVLVETLSTTWNFKPPAAPLAAPSPNGAQAPVMAPDVRAPTPVPLHSATSTPTPAPVVAGGGNILSSTCPICGGPLQRATVAGYRVAYCDHCRYRQQELVSGPRR